MTEKIAVFEKVAVRMQATPGPGTNLQSPQTTVVLYVIWRLQPSTASSNEM